MFRFESLEIWHSSRDYAGKIYNLTKGFPKTEIYGISDQLRRSAGSIPANIAEGSGSPSKKDFSHFLDIAQKSLYETVSHLYIAKDQNYINEDQRQRIYDSAEQLMRQIKKFQYTLRT
ncbi:MAG: four helix bundle protein [Candidatus Levybacteria bacterium]|nr:four helix bundle protein [Candidatus Levybacteria bacterium]